MKEKWNMIHDIEYETFDRHEIEEGFCLVPGHQLSFKNNNTICFKKTMLQYRCSYEYIPKSDGKIRPYLSRVQKITLKSDLNSDFCDVIDEVAECPLGLKGTRVENWGSSCP